MMTPKERAAMQQALEALERLPEMCGIEEAITALREALAEPDMNLSCKSVQARLATLWGYVKADQAEQEPREWINEDELPEFYPYDDMYQSSKVINGVRMFPNVKVSDRSMFYALTKDHTWISVTETQFNKLKPECRMKCYAAPVSIEAAVLAERERIIKLCAPYGLTGECVVAAIRARSEK